MRSRFARPGHHRRGVTLVEMLVVVALLVLMMTILVQIFQSAAGAMSLSRTTQELDVVLRQVDSMIRADLVGSTARMTPPNDPALKTGYFEYGENSPADAQGEDTDDWLAFTTKAPQGQVFYGRQFLATVPNNIQPITISSQVGEVIYFLRNGNLYRRVFLVAPERAKAVAESRGPQGNFGYQTNLFGSNLNVSWQGLNDISCRPGGFSKASNGSPLPPVPNDLGDLTNREKRAFRPQFRNDFVGIGLTFPDGVPDDFDGDGVPDYYPTLYYDGKGGSSTDPSGNTVWTPNSANLREAISPQRLGQSGNSYDVYAFPYIYPGMYSVPDPSRVNNLLGWTHYQPLNNHSPLDIGDSLATPSTTQTQTWWGFPTWRETMAGASSGGGVGWKGPVEHLGNNSATPIQPFGLRPFDPTKTPSATSTNLLPPVFNANSTTIPFGFDGAGSASFVANPDVAGSKLPLLPNRLWEDDLILTNVRSFDIKAYDVDAPRYNGQDATGNPVLPIFSAGYQDLGFGAANYLAGWQSTGAGLVAPKFQPIAGADPVGFGHEGRIPPMTNDFRSHPRIAALNIGDDHPGVIRLTRTWDSWSTDYTNAPDADVFNQGYIPGLNASAPLYPSFPAPYPTALRGIQIQIRITDPRNERSKVLTIRHDFTDKL